MCGLVAAALVSASTASAIPAVGKATVTFVQGTAQYMYPGQDWKSLTPSVTLNSGAVVRTAAGSFVYMAVNGKTSAVRVSENSVMALEKMQDLGTVENDTDTMLDIRAGTVSGDVKKLSKASHYDIRTPNGVAGIRGTRWLVTVTQGANQIFQVSIDCVQGQMVFATMVNGQPATVVIDANQVVVTAGPNSQVIPAAASADPNVINQVNIDLNQVLNPPNPEPPVTPNPEPFHPTPVPTSTVPQSQP